MNEEWLWNLLGSPAGKFSSGYALGRLIWSRTEYRLGRQYTILKKGNQVRDYRKCPGYKKHRQYLNQATQSFCWEPPTGNNILKKGNQVRDYRKCPGYKKHRQYLNQATQSFCWEPPTGNNILAISMYTIISLQVCIHFKPPRIHSPRRALHTSGFLVTLWINFIHLNLRMVLIYNLITSFNVQAILSISD